MVTLLLRSGVDFQPVDVYAVGTRVECKYKGKGKYYPGVIVKVHEDGTFDIDEDDGEKEYKVRKDLVRLLQVMFEFWWSCRLIVPLITGKATIYPCEGRRNCFF